MGVDAVLVLDEVHDVDRLISQMTIPDPRVRKRHLRPHGHQTMKPAFDGLVFDVRPDSFYRTEPDSPFAYVSRSQPVPVKPDRVFVSMLSRYWYPGESHYSPGNWDMVSTVCQAVWVIEPGIVVHYMPEPDSLFDVDPVEIIKDAHLLTPERVAELDEESARAEAGG
jgi:hypothetical protein